MMMRLGFRKSLLAVFAVAAALTSWPAPALGVTWGSFDASRVNYTEGHLNGGKAHSDLKALIEAGGHSLAAGTATLDASYLEGVEVFYTSIVKETDGALSQAEQTAVQDWVESGGTLIVIADHISPSDYDSYTTAFGVTDYTGIGVPGKQQSKVVDDKHELVKWPCPDLMDGLFTLPPANRRSEVHTPRGS